MQADIWTVAGGITAIYMTSYLGIWRINKMFIDKSDKRIDGIKQDLGNCLERSKQEYVPRGTIKVMTNGGRDDVSGVKQDIKDLRGEVNSGFKSLNERIDNIIIKK